MAYKINLKHRGSDVIEWIDLFDEASYGADKLFFRGRFLSFEEVKTQILGALGIGEYYDMDTAQSPENLEEFKLSLGVGNPLTTSPSDGNLTNIPTIALNRWNIPNKKFWNNTPPMNVINPYKASNAVTFAIRLHFYNDFAYITFGCPWSEIQDSLNDTETESSITDTNELVKKFKLIQCHFISKDDAIQVLKTIGLEVDEWDKNIKHSSEETTSVLNIIDEDGTQIEI